MTFAASVVGTVALAGAFAGGSDPRPRLVELVRGGDAKGALALAEESLAADPADARAVGVDFLRARLLERLGRPSEANEALAQALASASPLAPWARLRLALAQESTGHPEVAAGLAATLLAKSPPESLVRPALELLLRTLDRGGDCRLLGGLARDRFGGEERRLRDLAELKCRLKLDARAASRAIADFLAEQSGDPAAWEALETVLARSPDLVTAADRALAQKLALAAFAHRDFDLALRLLPAPLGRESRPLLDAQSQELAYAGARSAFWLGRHREAAERFEAIARASPTAPLRADALYQKARTLELAEEREGARATYVRAYQEDPLGAKAGAALLGALRIELLAGDEESARRRLSALAGVTKFASETARAALFVAVSDLVRGRAERAPALLSLAERTREAAAEEIAYWKGRQAEARGDLESALERYLETGRRRPFHPLSAAARRRLAAPKLAAVVSARRRALLEEASPRALRLAADLAADAVQRASLQARGIELLRAGEETSPWLTAQPIPVAEWRLWRAQLARPDELMLALGLPEEGPSAVARHFPPSPPRSGLTGAHLLAGGPAARRAIQIAEASFARLPSQVPFDWVDRDWLALLYPLPWTEAVRSQARAHGIDPALLAAVIREESRFDASAVSPASARGLTQLVLPTARRLAQSNGLPSVQASDLHDPLIAIPLGAAYLAQLAARFQGDPLSIAAAYNAGEEQVVLWRRGCLSAEPEELLAKIGFGETRAYATRVLESLAVYRVVWGDDLR
jgi:soluble lytic murein transglycosylase